MQKFLSFVKDCKTVLIITSRPLDLDCVGSGLILYKYLKSLGKRATIIHPSKFKAEDRDFFGWLPDFKQIKDTDSRPFLKSKKFDLLVLVDGMNLTQFLDDRVADTSIPDLSIYPKRIHIDHHATNPEKLGSLTYYQPKSSSTTEIVLTKIVPPQSISPEIATLGYAGIAGDTGNFSWSFSPQTLKLAAQLLAKGAQALQVVDKLFFSKPQSYFESLKFALDHTEYFQKLGTTLFCLSHKTIRKNNFSEAKINEIKRAYADEISKVIPEYPRGITLTEKDQGVITLSGRGNSLRNKVSLPELFKTLGGNSGGHFNAAGARVEGNFESVKKALLNSLQTMLTAS